MTDLWTTVACEGMDTNAWDVGLIAVFGLTVVAVFWIMRRYR